MPEHTRSLHEAHVHASRKTTSKYYIIYDIERPVYSFFNLNFLYSNLQEKSKRKNGKMNRMMNMKKKTKRTRRSWRTRKKKKSNIFSTIWADLLKSGPVPGDSSSSEYRPGLQCLRRSPMPMEASVLHTLLTYTLFACMKVNKRVFTSANSMEKYQLIFI